ncbi:hypothetical protein [Pseudomonas sp. Q1]|uniref:hypothetical protein n=1 Tax=Pseudomonas sp. Q1 TaxID=2202823 RepID=UPI001374DBF2|nr:hypothetical protein [Pseudomonas sp. Q1]NCE85273.1 hypothetical protein [Pseudomonas sp. Q1]
MADKRPAPKNFQEVFYRYLDDMERRAHAVGLTLTDLCRESKVARATPDRWRKSLPKTIQNVCDLEAIVKNAEQTAKAAEAERTQKPGS